MLTSRRLGRLYPVLGLLGACAQALATSPACNSSIYCGGDLLQRVQLARLFPDSKTFVDLKHVHSESDTLAAYARLLNDTGGTPSRDRLRGFVDAHFVDGDELLPWSPPDFDPEPPILRNISDLRLREFARGIIGIWARLGRQVSPDVARQPDRYSFLPVPNGFIVPGGRFKEIYYWDSYWIVRGLIISNMTATARGMIENLLHLVDTFGYVPNGSRVYYLGRSQPPLLAAMVSAYLEASGDVGWLARHVAGVERELHYWLERKQVAVRAGGRRYLLLRYLADAGPAPAGGVGPGPRPESYFEDYTSARRLPAAEREEFYREMRSAAESGWDFSSRWFVTADSAAVGNLTDVHASRILPVDLNAMFAGALQLAGDFRARLKDRRAALKWWSLARYWRAAIDAVLWHPGDGVWYDYDAQSRAPRRHFYPSCAAPLWAGAVEGAEAPRRAARLVRYLLASGALEFPGGVPASVLHSGEQWDYPNAWPPLQSVLVGALHHSGHAEAARMAREQAALWLRANELGFRRWGTLFEKYSAVQPGHQGGGGEYTVQEGFGWTLGVALELLQLYGKDLALEDSQAALPYVRRV